MHPGVEGMGSLPFFDKIDDMEQIDVCLVTHFHIDHCAALPYLTEKTSFRGRIFMTHPTKAVMKLLLADNLKLQTKSKPLYTEQDLQKCIDKIEVIDYYQTIEHVGIRFTPTPAGHVLGAAMFTIEIDGIRILYTGDYSLEEDRHLMSAEIPTGGPPDVLIVESTFGVMNLPNSEEREAKFTKTVDHTVSHGGSCLIPVFALGRAQELLLILDEYWQRTPHLHKIPVLYVSKLASKAMRVYETFINMMSHHIRKMMDIQNPFKLQYVKNQKQDFDYAGPCVVLASPGFLTSGVSRTLFERWCDDDRNSVIIAGYTIENTLAHQLAYDKPSEIKCMDGRIKPRRCQVEHISFSAHVDYQQNCRFIRAVKPDNIILVHGDKTGMLRLQSDLERDIRKNWVTSHRPRVMSPYNGQVISITFNKSIVADVVGKSATELLDALDSTSTIVNEDETDTKQIDFPKDSVLVTENFVSRVVSTNEISSFTSCQIGRVLQRILIPMPKGLGLNLAAKGDVKSEAVALLDLLVPHLEDLFDIVVYSNERLQLQGLVMISIGTKTGDNSKDASSSFLVEWEGSPMGDLVADTACGCIMQVLSAPSILRLTMSSASIGKRRAHSHSNAASSQENEAHAALLKKMKTGLLDPSQALPADAVSLAVGEGKMKLMTVKEALLTGSHKDIFSSIQLNAAGNTLIFRGQDKNDIIPEAYCFILWDTNSSDNSNSHNAVIKSEHDEFRQKVIIALQEFDSNIM